MQLSCHSPMCCRDFFSLRLAIAHALRWNVSGAAAYAHSFPFDYRYWTT